MRIDPDGRCSQADAYQGCQYGGSFNYARSATLDESSRAAAADRAAKAAAAALAAAVARARAAKAAAAAARAKAAAVARAKAGLGTPHTRRCSLSMALR